MKENWATSQFFKGIVCQLVLSNFRGAQSQLLQDVRQGQLHVLKKCFTPLQAPYVNQNVKLKKMKGLFKYAH